MPPLETPLRLSTIFRQLRPIHLSRRALLSSSTPRHIPSLPPTIPTTPQCPPSRCSCAEMPSGLAIDYEKTLSGTMPPYTQHVVIRTGKSDWSSKIEDEPDRVGGGVNFARELKMLTGRGGRFHDPSRPILVTNSNEPLPYDENTKENQEFHAAQVYPQNISVSGIPHTRQGCEQFAATFLASRELLDRIVVKTRNAPPVAKSNGLYLQGDPIPTASILICGHNSRDTRCGILGPLLQSEFKKLISNPTNVPPTHKSDQHIRKSNRRPQATVALISHIGGHAFAGNVVIYFPQTWRVNGGSRLSPLAGKGVWYGRVEPRHVWGIVEETVKGGRVVGELLRGICMPEGGGYVGELLRGTCMPEGEELGKISTLF